jgi:hypothetical protein
VSCVNNNDVCNKLQRFQYMCGIIQYMFKTSNKGSVLTLCKIMVVTVLLYGCDNLPLLRRRALRQWR